MLSVVFFQAEDGIRDLTVTGVQTCALPIWSVLGWGDCEGPESVDGRSSDGGVDLVPDAVPTPSSRDPEGRPGTGERVEDRLPDEGVGADEPFRKLVREG